MLKRIAITGPESTGKSSLCEQLANYFNEEWVPEVARTYIDNLNRDYTANDILEIAKLQVDQEEKLAKNANQFLFCDTELIVTKIWSEHKYQKCDPWILDEISKRKYHLYLLCDVDLPWEPDPQREHPDLRAYFFKKYKEELRSQHRNYKIVSGEGEQRLENAIKIITESL